MTLLNIYFKDYWQGNELLFLINNFIIDDEKYVDLSIKLSELNGEIKLMTAMLGDKKDGIWKVERKNEFIKTKRDNELVSLAVRSMEKIQSISHNIVQIIDEILNDKRRLKTG